MEIRSQINSILDQFSIEHAQVYVVNPNDKVLVTRKPYGDLDANFGTIARALRRYTKVAENGDDSAGFERVAVPRSRNATTKVELVGYAPMHLRDLPDRPGRPARLCHPGHRASAMSPSPRSTRTRCWILVILGVAFALTVVFGLVVRPLVHPAPARDHRGHASASSGASPRPHQRQAQRRAGRPGQPGQFGGRPLLRGHQPDPGDDGARFRPRATS